MAYNKDAQLFSVQLTNDIWFKVYAVAEDQGYSSIRSYINGKTVQLGAVLKDQPLCKGKKRKRQNTYQIPRHLEKTFATLACKFNTPVSTIITALILADVLRKLPEMEKQDLTL